MKTSNKPARYVALVLAMGVGLVAGACGPSSDYRIEKVCEDFCMRVVDCNDNNDLDDCIDNCIDGANDCDSDDDVANSLDRLELCAEESCNDVAACTLDAWLECVI